MNAGSKLVTTLVVILLTIATSLPLLAQDQGSALSGWTLLAAPSYTMPLVDSNFVPSPLYGSAWGGNLIASYAFSQKSPLNFRLRAGYSTGGLAPSQGVEIPGSLSEVSMLTGFGIDAHLGRELSAGAYLESGASYGALSSGLSSFYPSARAGATLACSLGPRMLLGLDASILYQFGLYGGLNATLGVGYRLPAPGIGSQPTKLHLLRLASVDLKSVFPILRSYYDEHPLGSVKIVNTGKQAAVDVQVNFLVRQYMDAPKQCATIKRLEPGASVNVPIYALFNDQILNVTEATKVTGEVQVSCAGAAGESSTATVTVYDRNALTWDDNRKAAAFVSDKDPWVLVLSGSIMAAVKSFRNDGLERNLQTAIALHEGLKSYGIGYMLSTARPFATTTVDTLKFPRQTLGYHAGDCADLSVLYASCLEAAGVETALITIPGHMFMAIDLGIPPDQARERSIDPSQIVIQDGRVWLPIEATMRDAGFMDIWRTAADEWRQASAQGTAALYPVHDAWKTFAPVGLPADSSSVAVPPKDAVARDFQSQLAKAVSSELGVRLAALGPLPAQASQATIGVWNKRGVLYAIYGKYAEAEHDFRSASAAGSMAALMNLGNLAMLKSDPATAYDCYRQAAQRDPNNAKILVNLARAAAGLGKSSEVAADLASVREIDPAVADKYASLAMVAGSSGTRAAEVSTASIIWF